MKTHPSFKNSESSFGRYSAVSPTSDEANAAIIKNRSLITKSVGMAAQICFSDNFDTKTLPTIGQLVEFYTETRKRTTELLGSVVPPEHREYVVISEFTRVVYSITDHNDPKSFEAIFYTGADVIRQDRRDKNAFSLRPWTVLFEKFLQSQENKEWSISTSLFSTWTDPEKCVFGKQDMALVVRAHLSALGYRMGSLDSEQAAKDMHALLNADSQLLMSQATIHGRRYTSPAKAKQNMRDTCHRVLSDISLHRSKEGLVQ